MMASPVSSIPAVHEAEIKGEAGGPAAVDAQPEAEKKPRSKAKLAASVAATFGVMMYYAWREKRLQKKDPEAYAKLQRLKASIHAAELEIENEAKLDREKEARAGQEKKSGT